MNSNTSQLCQWCHLWNHHVRAISSHTVCEDFPLAPKPKRRKRSGGSRRTLNTAQLKVRLPEVLRRELESAAAKTGWSMNSEILERLGKSFRATDPTQKIIATALLNNLDDDVVHEMVRIYMQDRGEEELGEAFREECK
jgi:hypothetical protein